MEKSHVPREVLDEIWQILKGKGTETAKVIQIQEELTKVIPDGDDFGGCEYCYEAQEALLAINATLEAYLYSNLERIVSVSKAARSTIDIFIQHEDPLNVSIKKDGWEKVKEALASHPLAVREMAKQTEDLQRLKEIKTLDKDFLEWLRTSYDNDGKSLIDIK